MQIAREVFCLRVGRETSQSAESVEIANAMVSVLCDKYTYICFAERITHHASRVTHHASRITHHASRFTNHTSPLKVSRLVRPSILLHFQVYLLIIPR